MNRSRFGAAWIWVLALAAAAAIAGAVRGGFTDLFVYQYAGRSVIDGMPLYHSRDPVMGLPFTYPPFAALLMVPLALLPAWTAAGLWTAASVAALCGVVMVVRNELGHRTSGWLVAALGVGSLALEPVLQNFTFGQINLIVMLAVLVDVLRPERRWSGVLLGVVAGVKLTPLVFVVLLVLVGRRAAAGRAALSFAVTVELGFLAMPGSATSYWTDGLLDAGRVGPPALTHNQSVYGVLARLLDGPPPTLLWVLVAGLLAVPVLLAGAIWWLRGDRLLGTCLAALAMLLASPVSWTHHWVWAVPVALLLWQRDRWWAGAWTAVFVLRPVLWPAWGDGREYAWDPLDHVLGNAYVLAALAFAAWAAASAAAVTLSAAITSRLYRRSKLVGARDPLGAAWMPWTSPSSTPTTSNTSRLPPRCATPSPTRTLPGSCPRPCGRCRD